MSNHTTHTVAEVEIGEFTFSIIETVDQSGNLEERLYQVLYNIGEDTRDEDFYEDPAQAIEHIQSVSGLNEYPHAILAKLFTDADAYWSKQTGRKVA